jgi:hypothetical protein
MAQNSADRATSSHAVFSFQAIRRGCLDIFLDLLGFKYNNVDWVSNCCKSRFAFAMITRTQTHVRAKLSAEIRGNKFVM